MTPLALLPVSAAGLGKVAKVEGEGQGADLFSILLVRRNFRFGVPSKLVSIPILLLLTGVLDTQ